MQCTVEDSKGLHRLAKNSRGAFKNLLIAMKTDMEANGPIREDWTNFSALTK